MISFPAFQKFTIIAECYTFVGIGYHTIYRRSRKKGRTISDPRRLLKVLINPVENLLVGFAFWLIGKLVPLGLGVLPLTVYPS